MKLLPETPEEEHVLKMAAEYSIRCGFAAIKISDDFSVSIIPPIEIYKDKKDSLIRKRSFLRGKK